MYNFFKDSENESLYNFSTDLAENPFGAQLLSVCSELYEDIDTAIEDVVEGAQAQGVEISEDDLVGLMTGEYIPSEEFLLSLEDLFVEVDEDGNEELLEDEYSRLISAAQASHDLAEATEIAVAEALTEDEYEEDDDDADEDGDKYVVSPYLDLKGRSAEQEELDALRAQLEAQENRTQTTESLDQVVEYASHLVTEGKLPPFAFRYMLGDENRTSASRFAEFSSFCEEEDVDSSEHLGQIAYALSVFEQCAPAMDFSVYADEEIEDNSVDKDTQATISGMFQAYKQSRA